MASCTNELNAASQHRRHPGCRWSAAGSLPSGAAHRLFLRTCRESIGFDHSSSFARLLLLLTTCNRTWSAVLQKLLVQAAARTP